ncbi:latrophilin-3-like isoform X1, putative [Babesia ovata]|uniref:Latrophilin-3-like isoform X1, putative n=1 Tax=Babesia ovata TaxID=189622 RepID=A0A2H6KIZ2_9APIC|nr:latrophilin-3-like isoform X1, putative [Babesia ovata]GBE62960.1 latrophilin-3-like isoform X1, putative [Babesia ovata]
MDTFETANIFPFVISTKCKSTIFKTIIFQIFQSLDYIFILLFHQLLSKVLKLRLNCYDGYVDFAGFAIKRPFLQIVNRQYNLIKATNTGDPWIFAVPKSSFKIFEQRFHTFLVFITLRERRIVPINQFLDLFKLFLNFVERTGEGIVINFI